MQRSTKSVNVMNKKGQRKNLKIQTKDCRKYKNFHNKKNNLQKDKKMS